MPIKLATVNKNESTPLRLLQIGDTGTGKSTRAADATRWGRVYFFDFDGKMNLIARSLPATKQELIEFDTYTDVEAALRFAETLTKSCPYDTVVVDTISVFNQMVEEYVKVKLKTPLQSKLGYEGWDYIRNILCDFYFNKLNRLPCNIIVNCHVDKAKDAEGREVLGAAGRGGFVNLLPMRMTDTQYLTFALGKFIIKAKKSDKVAVNSYVSDSDVDSQGNLKVTDLSVFDAWVRSAKTREKP